MAERAALNIYIAGCVHRVSYLFPSPPRRSSSSRSLAASSYCSDAIASLSCSLRVRPTSNAFATKFATLGGGPHLVFVERFLGFVFDEEFLPFIEAFVDGLDACFGPDCSSRSSAVACVL